jgi:predicted dehydrogenase
MTAGASQRRRLGVVGVGHRAGNWIDAAVGTHRDAVEVVALCDPVRQRCVDAIGHWKLAGARAYTDAADMLAQARLDLVLVCLPESLHAPVIVAALDAGCRVITEKPLCTVGDDAVAILAAERRTARPIVMGFNYRHIPLCRTIKQVISEGAIGTPISADLTWYLDYKGHGGSYFRRWHAVMKHSGGLLITKATHHFDLANWWLGDKPQSVYARAHRRLFGREHSPFGGDHANRCRDCHQGPKCPMVRPPIDTRQRSLELGYEVRTVADYDADLCVYRDEIDIYDTHALVVQYAGGCVMNYTLNAGVPFEGWNLAINGSNGRLETGITDAKPAAGWQEHFAIAEHGGGLKLADPRRFYVTSWPREYRIHVMPHDRIAYEVKLPNIAEGHGGGDFAIYRAALTGELPADDPLRTFATALDGARSMAIGAAANRAVVEDRPVRISEILGEFA